MNAQNDQHVSLCLDVERMALAMRYLTYLVVVFLFLLNYIQGSAMDLVVITIVLGLHSVFAHWVLLSGRHHLFLGRLNFIIYFLETSFVVKFTGAESSDAYIMYHLLLIGYSAYMPSFRKTMLVALLLAFSYAAVILIEYAQVGIEIPAGIIVVKLLSILLCGWLVGSLSDRLSRTQDELSGQARALAASEATLRTILNSAADPILVYDDNEFISEANDRAAELFGTPRQELLGRRLRAFLFDDGTRPQKMAALRARGAAEGQEVVITTDGEERIVEFTVRSFIRNQERFYVAIFRDTTEQKELQEATRLANVNLARLNRELKQVDELKTGFLATISQKLRSPLSAVLGHVEMLLDEELGEITPEQRRALHACRRATLRSFQLTDDALTLPKASPESVETAAQDPKEDE